MESEDLKDIVRKAYDTLDLSDDTDLKTRIEILRGLADDLPVDKLDSDEFGRIVTAREQIAEESAEIMAVALLTLERALDDLTIDPSSFLVQFGSSEVEVKQRADVD